MNENLTVTGNKSFRWTTCCCDICQRRDMTAFAILSIGCAGSSAVASVWKTKSM